MLIEKELKQNTREKDKENKYLLVVTAIGWDIQEIKYYYLHGYLKVIIFMAQNQKYGRYTLSENIILNDVLIIDDFKFNLISFIKLTKDSNCVVYFIQNLCKFQELSTNTVITAIACHLRISITEIKPRIIILFGVD